jgi:hypothetical protein
MGTTVCVGTAIRHPTHGREASVLTLATLTSSMGMSRLTSRYDANVNKAQRRELQLPDGVGDNEGAGDLLGRSEIIRHTPDWLYHRLSRPTFQGQGYEPENAGKTRVCQRRLLPRDMHLSQGEEGALQRPIMLRRRGLTTHDI